MCEVLTDPIKISLDAPEVRIMEVYSRIEGRGDGSKAWKNLKCRARRNGYSLPKQVLVDSIKKSIRKNGKLRRNYDAVLIVELPCGEASYKTWGDIPSESVPCSCGNPNHWFIKYEEE